MSIVAATGTTTSDHFLVTHHMYAKTGRMEYYKSMEESVNHYISVNLSVNLSPSSNLIFRSASSLPGTLRLKTRVEEEFLNFSPWSVERQKISGIPGYLHRDLCFCHYRMLTGLPRLPQILFHQTRSTNCHPLNSNKEDYYQEWLVVLTIQRPQSLAGLWAELSTSQLQL